jgi:hypothetical protein
LTTKNFTFLAQNTENSNYIEQACLAAMSIHATNTDVSICLITNNTVPDEYQKLFNHIVEIPWGDHAENETWKVSNRWKIYHAIPYTETVVMDTDMLVLQDLTTWFEFLQNYDLYYTSKVLTYRGKEVSGTYYRRAFDKFNLPNLYSGFHWFKKSELAHEFYTWMEMITNNYQQFYKQHAGGKTYQNFCSMDLNAAIAARIMDCETQITNTRSSYPTFVHMKSKIQNWNNNYTHRWQDNVGVYLTDDLVLKIGNYKQSGVFHYTENDFVTERIVNKYKTYLGL